PGLPRQPLEVGAGEQGDVVTAGLERLAQGEEGVDVAVAAHRHQQDVGHRSPPEWARKGPGGGNSERRRIGKGKARQIDKAVGYLKDPFVAREHFWYGHYYAAHALHQVGGKEWKDWYDRMVRTFLPLQRSDGSWSGGDRNSAGPVYQTSIAVISLSVPMHYL